MNGWDTPSHDYDLIHQRIEVGNFDWDSTSFDGRVTTTAVARRDRGSTPSGLDMERKLEVRAVTGRPSEALKFDRPGDTLVVRLPRAVGMGRHGAVHRRLSRAHHARAVGSTSSRRSRDGRTGRSRSTAAAAPTGIRAGSPPGRRRTTRPPGISSPPSPPRLTVVSNGRLVSDRRTARSRVSALGAGEAGVHLSHQPGRGAVRPDRRAGAGAAGYYVYREDSTLARPLFGVTADMIRVFARLTGVPFPWNKYAQVTVADFIGGMENVSATTLVDWLPDARAYRDRPWYRQSLIPARAGPPVVRQPGHRGELGQLLAQRGHGRVHAGPVLGRHAGPPRGGGLLPR